MKLIIELNEKEKETIVLSKLQEDFLVKFATNHYPGADDNLATRTPITVVEEKEYFYIPYNLETEDRFSFPVVFSIDGDDRTWVETEKELVIDWYSNLEKVCPIEIKDFSEVLNTETIDCNGNVSYIRDFSDYFDTYGLKNVSIAFKTFHYRNVAFFFILDEAKAYIKYQSRNLNEPRTYSYSPGYSNNGEFENFYNLLMSIGTSIKGLKE